ncbi:hypothetical protein [Bifidobacterium bombi]|uniref:hypothetical protein n=1 Tax=Bifidobacterium bombi TaxID=471511 RepID=UPI000B1C1425|nr:hypothetical protein [Bifidobacterium bombi]
MKAASAWSGLPAHTCTYLTLTIATAFRSSSAQSSARNQHMPDAYAVRIRTGAAVTVRK